MSIDMYRPRRFGRLFTRDASTFATGRVCLHAVGPRSASSATASRALFRAVAERAVSHGRSGPASLVVVPLGGGWLTLAVTRWLVAFFVIAAAAMALYGTLESADVTSGRWFIAHRSIP